MSTTSSNDCYLKLCDNPRTFKPTAPTTNVFFDNTNGQIFSVELGDETKISVRGKTEEDSFEFKIKDKGIVKSIKFSPSNHVLALQRTRNSIEFITMTGRVPNTVEIVQHSKGKNNKIYGFEWINNKEIVFITEQSVEIYDVDVNNMFVKLIKSMSINSHWFVYDHKTKLLLLSTGGNYNNILQPLQIQTCGEINKLSRFEIELTATSPMSSQPLTSAKLLVLEEDVVLTYLYHLPRILIIRHQQRGSPSTQVIVYTVYKYKTVKRTHTLELDRVDGKFALNIVDNLIIVHHKSSKTSLVFDIQLSIDSLSGGIVSYKLPVCEGRPIGVLEEYESYSSNWVMFEPDIIIHVKKGLLFTLQLDIPVLCRQFKNNKLLFEFLILRNLEQEHVLCLLRKVFLEEAEDYVEMVQFVEMINFYYEQYVNYQIQINTGKSVRLISLPDLSPQENSLDEVAYLKYNYTRRIIISPSVLYDTIFIRLNEAKSKHNLLVMLLIEYIKSLIDHNITEIDFCIYELLIKTLIYQKKYYQLHQILQYYIVKDSKQIACLLLPLEKLYRPAYQLALDMLDRLGASEEINHILLYKPNNVITALRYNARSDACLRALSRKLLQLSSKLPEGGRAASGTLGLESERDRVVFYSVFRFYVQYCRQYNFNLLSDQKCFKYIELYEGMFKGRVE